ncbi:MAG: ABC-2 transporter permease [Kiritimatiellia bacterium]
MKHNSPTFVVFRREWASYFNSPVAYVFLVIFLVLSAVFTFQLSPFFQADNAELNTSFFFWHPWLFLILVPAITMGQWSNERRAHTIELLFTLPVTLAQAVIGKYLAALAFMVLALALTFPVVITVIYLGDPDIGVVLAGYAGSTLLAAAFLALGTFTSALSRDQVVSFILAVAAGLFLVLAGVPAVTLFLASYLPAWAVDFISSLGFVSHFEQMTRGVLDLRDVLYFLTVVALGLFATLVTLENKSAR